jgi:peptidoglycan/xylan/chitin deacetylase (PgdA/CDA1 family)
MFYIAKTPWWLKKLYGRCIWGFSPIKRTIYLTFDDGPHLKATPFVLAELKKCDAKATFFCIGKNAVENNDIYQRIINEGHSVGNHTYDHLNGWKTSNEAYIDNIDKARIHINSNLFRPPYGRIKKNQIKSLKNLNPELKIVMWSVLSGDFDINISSEKCLANVIDNAKSGAIIVFHDSEKAFNNLVYALPVVLKYFSERGFVFEKIPHL